MPHFEISNTCYLEPHRVRENAFKNARNFFFSQTGGTGLKYLPNGCPYMFMYSALHIMKWFSVSLDVIDLKTQTKMFWFNMYVSKQNVTYTRSKVIIKTRESSRMAISEFASVNRWNFFTSIVSKQVEKSLFYSNEYQIFPQKYTKSHNRNHLSVENESFFSAYLRSVFWPTRWRYTKFCQMMQPTKKILISPKWACWYIIEIS